MVKSVEGIYRDGKVELLEAAPAVDQSRVIVTFLPDEGTGQVMPLTTEQQIERLRDSFTRLSRNMGPRRWTREDLYER
jgi:hypothetical protein